jgi:hypothetical protein
LYDVFDLKHIYDDILLRRNHISHKGICVKHKKGNSHPSYFSLVYTFFLAASLKLSCVEYRIAARKQQGRSGVFFSIRPPCISLLGY